MFQLNHLDHSLIQTDNKTNVHCNFDLKIISLVTLACYKESKTMPSYPNGKWQKKPEKHPHGSQLSWTGDQAEEAIGPSIYWCYSW